MNSLTMIKTFHKPFTLISSTNLFNSLSYPPASTSLPLTNSLLFNPTVPTLSIPSLGTPSFSIFQQISSTPSVLFAAKKKRKRVVTIRLESEAGTGYFYTTTKNRTRHTHKLAFMKYDPLVDQHVLFTESKGAGKRRGKSRQKKGR